jgi:hypothetical protein
LHRLIHHKANAPYQGLSYSPKPPEFAARLLLGEFVTGYEVSDFDELNKEVQGIIDRNCLGTS